ncbi:uncharacterized protein LOC111046069 [Nilaparvata lugens]|uniref:uncharacterized protein LOC111046069 n=1 Tax=Nilaparvata lugens TaxID=108931 RepID=UPI00193E6FDF|nr:uncharacterized protein LOC111046069 [Nilaparvata lugens]
MCRVMNRGLAVVLLFILSDSVAESAEVIQNGLGKLKFTSFQSCTIPESKEYYYTSFDGTKRFLPKTDKIDGNGQQAVRVKCFESSKQSKASDVVVCFNGEWFPSDHGCVTRSCDPVANTTSTNYTCTTAEGRDIACDTPVPINSKITIHCSHWRYMNPNPKNTSKLCLEDGRWEKWDTCILECGGTLVKPLDDLSEIALYQNPWHVIIYRLEDSKWTEKCVGTILNNYMIITAHICFDFMSFEAKSAKVAVGQYYRDFETAQSLSRIYDVVLSPVMFSPLYEMSPLVIIMTETYIHYTDTVVNACFNFKPVGEIDRLLWKNPIEWRIAILRKDSGSTLKETENMLVASNSECLSKYADQLKGKRLRSDQFCAVFKSQRQFNTTDIGAGLMSLVISRGKSKRFYLRGILDGSSEDGGVLTFTDIWSMDNQIFLHSAINEFRETHEHDTG